MNNMRSIQEITERELEMKIEGGASWHHQYKDSAYVYIGGLDYELTEGDIIAVFSQYGEVININLVRNKKTGKSKGFCFLCYEDQRSTILAVDNFNGIKLCGRTIRVDHVAKYRRPKDEDGNDIIEKGCGPPEEEVEPPFKVKKEKKKKKKLKKEKKKKKKERELINEERNDGEENSKEDELLPRSPSNGEKSLPTIKRSSSDLERSPSNRSPSARQRSPSSRDRRNERTLSSPARDRSPLRERDYSGHKYRNRK